MDYEIGSHESRKGGKGIRKFRRPKNRIKNKILYGLLFATDMDNNNVEMKVKDLQKKLTLILDLLKLGYLREGYRMQKIERKYVGC